MIAPRVQHCDGSMIMHHPVAAGTNQASSLWRLDLDSTHLVSKSAR